MLAVSFKTPESAKRLIFEAAKENPTFIAPQLRIELERFAAHQNLFVRHQATHLKTFSEFTFSKTTKSQRFNILIFAFSNICKLKSGDQLNSISGISQLLCGGLGATTVMISVCKREWHNVHAKYWKKIYWRITNFKKRLTIQQPEVLTCILKTKQRKWPRLRRRPLVCQRKCQRIWEWNWRGCKGRLRFYSITTR